MGATLTTLAALPATVRASDPALAPVAAPAPASAIAQADLGPAARPTDSYRAWADERRKLRLQFGLSAGFAAAFLLSGVLAMTVSTCDPPPGAVDDYCGIPVGKILASGTLLSASAVAIVPTIVFGARLGKHHRRRPVAALQVAPGGLALRF